MNLTDFPSEILHNIVSHISRNSDLANITLVSPFFKDLAEPALYHNVHLNAESLEQCRVGFIPTLKWTDQLIANLKARPELGRHTTAFSLRVTHPLWYQSYPQISIISRMPRLRQLSYDPPAIHGGGLPNECKNLAALRLDFSHVTNHYIEDGGLLWLEHGIPLDIIAKHLWGPSLRKLQVEKLFFTDQFEHAHLLGQRRLRFGLSSVEDLRFLDCCPRVDLNVFTAFLNSIKHLKCFAFEINSPWEPLVGLNDRTPGVDVTLALQAHHKEIEELAISMTDHAFRYHDLVPSPISFVQWAALKRLAVPFYILRGVLRYAMMYEIFPPQLVELQLEGRPWTLYMSEVDYSWGNQAVTERDTMLFKDFAKRKEVCVPGLKHLIWWLQHPSEQWPTDPTYSLHASAVEMSVLETFKNVGVKFEWISTPFFKDTPFGQRLYEW